MRLSFITCEPVEKDGITEISLVIRDYAQAEFTGADTITMTWSRTPDSVVWDEPEIKLDNVFYCNADHSSKMLGMLHRLVEKGNKTSETKPDSIIMELARKGFRHIVYDKRISAYTMVDRIKSAKDTQYSLPEKYGQHITVDASDSDKAIKKITSKLCELGVANVQVFDVIKQWIADDYPLDKLSEADVPTVSSIANYVISNKK